MWIKRRCRVRKKNKSERGGEVKITTEKELKDCWRGLKIKLLPRTENTL
jgi:hypothetical protein